MSSVPHSIELTIVVPAFNEAARLPVHLPRVLDAIDSRSTELIVVDDGSTDGTADLAETLLGSRPSASVIRLPRNQGKGAAVRAGVAKSRGAAIAYMDADLAADIADLPLLLNALQTAHIAIGSRAVAGSVTKGATLARICMGRTFNRMARSATSLPILDFQCPFKAMRGSTARLLFHLTTLNRYAFDVEILALGDRLGFEIVEVPIHFEAVAGSHIRPFSDPLTMAADLLRIRSRRVDEHSVWAVSWDSGGADLDESAIALEALVPPNTGPVIRSKTGTTILLPFAEQSEAERIAAAIRHRARGFAVRTVVLSVSDLLGHNVALVATRESTVQSGGLLRPTGST